MHDITKNLDAITGGDRPALFPLGLVQTTPEALRALVASHGDVRGDADDPAVLAQPYLARHQRSLWPTLTERETQANLSAIEHGYPVTGRFPLPSEEALFVRNEGEDAIKNRPLTIVDVADTIDLLLYRGETSCKVIAKSPASPTGHRTLTVPFSTTEQAMDAFVASVREGRFAWRPSVRLRFFDLDTGRLLRDS